MINKSRNGSFIMSIGFKFMNWLSIIFYYVVIYITNFIFFLSYHQTIELKTQSFIIFILKMHTLVKYLVSINPCITYYIATKCIYVVKLIYKVLYVRTKLETKGEILCKYWNYLAMMENFKCYLNVWGSCSKGHLTLGANDFLIFILSNEDKTQQQ